MHTDPISDLLTRIRNASRAGLSSVSCPHSKIKEGILDVMKKANFIEDYEVKDREIIIELKENLDLTLRRISKPGQRIYIKKEELKPVKSGLGILILSTSRGIMTNLEAKKANIGGELLCEIY